MLLAKARYPDLLHYEASGEPGPRAGLSEALTFGFARGVDEERLCKLVAPTLAKSTFKPGSFADDLFLDDLVKGGFSLVRQGRKVDAAGAFFRRVLVTPPPDLRDVELRQGVLRELGQRPERRRQVEDAFFALMAFRQALCGSEHFSSKTVGVRRRIDILTSLRRAILELLKATSSASSGLSRVAEWLETVVTGEGYHLLSGLLDFESGRSVVETRLQVGYDGALRRFDVVRVSHVTQAPFPRGPVTRFFSRVWSLLKGYRFSEEDVMSQLLDQTFTNLETEVVGLLSLSLQLEFFLRGHNFFESCERQGLRASLPRILPCETPRSEQQLLGLFNPWLAVKGSKVVPCDLGSARLHSTTIVTGPNSGGKTRLLQSLAITQLLAQVGLYVPAREAVVVQVEQLFLSLIEQTQPDQSEGRLGLELVRIRQVFEAVGPHALVIMDEFCSGTNPSEGERIFEMVLGLFEELGPQVVITTHFLDFAARLRGEGRPSLRFLQVELGERDLPTYQFVVGVAETSLARNTAARLGVTREELRQLIKARMDSPKE